MFVNLNQWERQAIVTALEKEIAACRATVEHDRFRPHARAEQSVRMVELTELVRKIIMPEEEEYLSAVVERAVARVNQELKRMRDEEKQS